MDNKINPIAYYSGFISASRNIYLTSTVGIALFGYSAGFKINSSVDLVKFASMGILLFAILYGINTTYGMYKFVKLVEKNNQEVPEYFQLNLWNNYIYLNSYYIIILILVLLAAMRRFINRII